MQSNLVQVKWEARKKVLFSNLSILRKKDIHTDITLSCDGGSFAAHRLILTMGSGYFAKAFENVRGTSPSLVLICGIRASILECLLSFIYDGTTTIKSEELGDLSKAGIMLEVPGLMELGKEYTSLSESMKVPSISEESGTLPVSASTRSNNRKIIDAPESNCSNDDNVLQVKPLSGNKSTMNEEDDIQMCENGVTESLFDSDSCDGFEGWEKKEQKKARVISKDNIKIKKSTRGLKRSHRCQICNKSFFKLESLHEHIDSHSSPAPYVCKICGRGFRTERSYKTHILTHSDEEDVDSISVNSHVEDISRSSVLPDINNDTPPSSVQIISNKENLETPRRETKNKLDLTLDRQVKRRKNNADAASEHTIDDVLKSVSQSFKNFSTSEEYLVQDDSMYDQGITEIEGSNDFHNGADESDSILKLKETLNLKHSVTSVNTRVCRYCSAEFLNSKSFRKHRTASCKILECPYCLANFVTREEYNNHITVHAGIDRPFVCPECTYSTDVKRSFEDHISLHTGIFRFWCLLCDFQAKKLHELKEHTKFGHPEVNMTALEVMLAK